jgi:hypothetical protein
LPPTSAAFFAITARAIVVARTVWTEMSAAFFTTFFAIVKVMMARRAVETSVG